MFSKQNADELQSRVIAFLRFPLIVGVVFIHNYRPSIIVGNEVMGSETHMPTYSFIGQLFSQYIGWISVPLFFFFSGFLFFYKADYSLQTYIYKIKRRISTLLIPYLFWNASFLICFFAVSHLPLTRQWFQFPNNAGLDYYLSSFWGILDDKKTMTYPIAYQFWFIRDLMVLSLFSPVLYCLLSRFKGLLIWLIAVFWLCGYSLPYIGIRGLSTEALFFFSLGAVFSIYKRNFVNIVRIYGYYPYIFYLLMVAVHYAFMVQGHDVQWLFKLIKIAGILSTLNLSAAIVAKHNFRSTTFLASASFFVFAIHDPWLLSNIRKLLYVTLHPASDFAMVVVYFFNILLTVTIALALYYCLKRFLPSLLQLLLEEGKGNPKLRQQFEISLREF